MPRYRHWEGLATILLFSLVLVACTHQPTPPSRNVFYEVKTVTTRESGTEPVPTTVPAQSLSIEVADDSLLPSDLEAEWSINWQCASERCQFDQCIGTAHSTVRDIIDERWLEIDRRVSWNDGCGKRTSWLSQVDRYSGQERYPSQEDRLFNFWAGARSARPERQITLGDGRPVNAWCTGPSTAEIQEEKGWTTLYDGEVCYDVGTGMLVSMSYIKRWVYTGTFEGKAYERAYFGDSETYEQRLESTNAQLSTVAQQ